MSELVPSLERPAAPAGPTPNGAAAPQRERELTAEEQEAAREAQLQRLYSRIHERKDFPSLRDSIKSIQQVTRSDTAHMRALSDEVLQDVGLTNKLLRLINAAFYSSVGGGSITTVARAIALMGFEAVGRLAASLALFDRLPSGADGDRVRAEFSQALLAATLSRELCPSRQAEETIYVTGLFQNLGTMLAWLHFPDDAQDIEELIEERQAAQPDRPLDPSRLEAEVLGLSFEDLGVEIARQWGWPELLLTAMRPKVPDDMEAPVPPELFNRVACTAANRLARRCIDLADPDAIETCGRRFHAEWGAVLGLGEDDVAPLIERSLAAWKEMTLVLGLERKEAPVAVNGVMPRQGTMRQALTQGLKALNQVIQSDAPMDAVYRRAMEILMSALELQRCVVCLRDPQPPARLRARHGMGDRYAVLEPLIQVPLSPPSDLFGLLSLQGQDTLITDTDDPTIARNLPVWFRTRMRAYTFVVLPMRVGPHPIGMIYGDRADAGSLVIGEKELNLLKNLRDEVVNAMRQRTAAGGAKPTR